MSAVCNVRNLGTSFDNHLSMKTPLSTRLVNQDFTICIILGALNDILALKIESIVQAIVISRIDHCMVLPLRTLASSNGCKTRQSDWCDHCQDMNTSHSSFIRLHWLPIKFRINFKIAMLCFKCIHGHAPNYLKSRVAIKKTSTYNLRSSTSIQLEDHSRRSKKLLGDGAFSYASAKIWNSLPQSLKSQQNFNTFKTLLKTHYFREAFNL